MREARQSQALVLDNPSRVRIVRACPGSGKTWLVAELIRRELANADRAPSGIAALSFTRVAGQEIRAALARELGHPHFVGTLDSFFLRHVLRPFLPKVFSGLRAPKLVPAEWSPGRWTKDLPGVNLRPRIEVGGKVRSVPILDVAFIGELEGRPEFSYAPSPWEGPFRVTGDDAKLILEQKKALWQRKGWVTHSDAAFLAFHVLSHRTRGPVIRREICRKYPLVVIDELQDTGYFLGKSILSLLSEPGFRALLVGDPDQAIFEFNGARPDLFDTFAALEGAQELSLGESLRCSASVAGAAGHLSATNRAFQGTGDGAGRAILIGYRELEEDLTRIESALAKPGASGGVRVVARSGRTVEKLSRQNVPQDLRAVGSPALNHLHRATNLFRLRKLPQALAASKAFLGLVLFRSDVLTEEEVGERGISPEVWKRLAAELLLESTRCLDCETLIGWCERVEGVLAVKLRGSLAEGAELGFAIRRPNRRFSDLARADFLVPWPHAGGGKVNRSAQTVHAVKGETHETTILVVPEPRRDADCPSEAWWSNDTGRQEERRIIYVAATRSRGDFLLLAAQTVVDRLRVRRVEFCEAFDVMTTDEYLSRCGTGTEAWPLPTERAEEKK